MAPRAAVVKAHRVKADTVFGDAATIEGVFREKMGTVAHVEQLSCAPTASILRDPQSIIRCRLLKNGLWPDDVPAAESEIGTTFVHHHELASTAAAP